MPASPEEMAARVRAARGYKGMKALDLAKALNVSVETMSRIENGRRPPTPEEQEKIVTLCEVPDWFIEQGWEGRMLSEARQPDVVLRNQQGELLALVEIKSMRQAPPNTWIAIQEAMVGAMRGVGLDAHGAGAHEDVGEGTEERFNRIERQLADLSRALAERALQDARSRTRDAGTSPGEAPGRDAQGGGDSG